MKQALLNKYNKLIGYLLSVPGFGVPCSLSASEYGPLFGSSICSRGVMREDTSFTDEQFDDIDGEVNEKFQPLDTIVEFIDPEFTGGSDGWDLGEVEKEINVRLKDKE